MHNSTNWLPIVVIFILPLCLGIGLIFAAFKLRHRWTRFIAGIVGSIFVVCFVAAVMIFVPYMWASHLEFKWSPAQPKTRSELEPYLSLYSQRDIQPVQSEWGGNHVLEAGERMTQYLLLWSAPLDVVYSSNDTIVAIYTSYE